jgi:hypothetical protein
LFLSYVFEQAAVLYNEFYNTSNYSSATQITVFYNGASVAPDITHNTLPAINGTFSWSKTSGIIEYSAPAPAPPSGSPVEGMAVMGPEGRFSWVAVETFPENYEWQLAPNQSDGLFVVFENPDGFVCKSFLKFMFS